MHRLAILTTASRHFGGGPATLIEVAPVVRTNFDPLKLLEEMRAIQAYLSALADGDVPPEPVRIFVCEA